MNIVIGSTFHCSVIAGGNEIYAHTLAEAVSHKQHQVTYLTCYGKPGNYPYRLDMVNPLTWFITLIRLQPDLVHTSGTGIILTLTGLFCRLARIPCIATFQAPLNPPHWYAALAKWDERLTAWFFNRIIVTSPANAAYLKKFNTKVKVDTILLATRQDFPSERLHSKQEARRMLKLPVTQPFMLMVAALDKHHYYKGVDVAIQMIALVPHYHLIICGRGELLEYYRTLVTTLGVGNRVHFVDYVPDDQLPFYYEAADLTLFPSTSSSEGFGLVLIESMLMKTPVVTTTAVGISPLLKKHACAIVAAPGSVASLAKAVLKVTPNRQKLITHGYRFAKSLSVDTMVKQTLASYRKVLRTYG